MTAYIIRRLLLIIPTLFGIMVVNFFIVQAAPGGPVEKMLAQIQGLDVAATERVSGGTGDQTGGGMRPGTAAGSDLSSKYRGARGLDPEFVKSIERQFGFDKPIHERFVQMIVSYATFDFGDSYFRGRPVVDLVLEKMPVSISLGIWTMLLVYLISIPLGIAKAVRDGSRFDVWSSAVVIVGNAIPSFLFAILLIVLFAGGRYLDWFPLRGLVSDDFSELSVPGKIGDYFWHITLPVLSMVIGGFAGLTMLTKNSFLEEINKQYVTTARSKGVTERRAFVGILFTGALLTEIIFSLDGLGLLGFEAAINRDYPIMFGTLYFFTLLGLILNLIGDLMYHVVDPRIDFERREA
jgi:microcin C transport system permease protein